MIQRFHGKKKDRIIAVRAEGVGTMVLKCQEKMEAMEVPKKKNRDHKIPILDGIKNQITTL